MKNAEASTTGTFSDFEREAMRNRANELRAEAKAGKNRAAGEKAIQEAIAAMTGSDKTMATKVHELITAAAPELMPKTWYGMPAYANKDGKVVCFFQPAIKFEARYATLGFSDMAKLDNGNMWASSFALVKLTAAEEAEITKLVKQAVS